MDIDVYRIARSGRIGTALAAVAFVAYVVPGPAQEPAQQAAAPETAILAPSKVPAWAFPLPPNRAGGGGRRDGARGGEGAGRAGGRGRAAQDMTPLTVPDSTVTYLPGETNQFNIADWHPDRHPPLPSVVQYGRRPGVGACGYCHLANGFGKPENAPLAGQPVEYIVQQMRDYRDGRRLGSEPRVVGPSLMVNIAKAATDEEIRIAAEYFASVKRTPWIRVIETDTVPITRNTGVMYAVVEGEGAGTEPLGVRILEVAENYALTQRRDGGSGFIAYAPVGSLARGEALVKTGGNGKTLACAICHGPDMRGLGAVPSIAGRSPSYMGRQMYDFTSGSRNGLSAPLMKPVVAQLTDQDIVDILAYLATLAP
jgi:cytochrome c553